VAMQLMRVEIQRAAWLSQGLSVLAEDPVLARADIDLRELLARIVAELQPERALVGLNLVIERDAEMPNVHADERLLSIALAGGLAAMRAITERVHGGLLHCAVRSDGGGGSVVIEISQNTVTFPASRLARFFDMAWAERPGGYRAAVGILAARRIAELHAGTLEVIGADEGGCTLRMELPAEPVSSE
jgi:nitrogen fixation/metabolism regulation signal transduction histidine kinase